MTRLPVKKLKQLHPTHFNDEERDDEENVSSDERAIKKKQ